MHLLVKLNKCMKKILAASEGASELGTKPLYLLTSFSLTAR